MQCQQCEDAACMNVCPAKAIYLEESTGAKIIDQNKCIGCKMCMIACPFGAVTLDPLSNKVSKCDLCVGDPACAKFCATGAIRYLPADTYGLLKQMQAAKEVMKVMSISSRGA